MPWGSVGTDSRNAPLFCNPSEFRPVKGQYLYAQQRGLSKTLVNLLVDKLKPKDLDIAPKYYLQITELAIRVTQADYPLTNAQKAFAIGSTWWNRKHENLYRNALFLLNEWDVELRVSIKKWNEGHPTWLTDPLSLSYVVYPERVMYL
jgi:hypothetical protein